MPLLFHWRGENYRKDMAGPLGYELNQNSPAMLKATPGEVVWAFTRREDGAYVLALRGVVAAFRHNPPGHRYGRYGVDLVREKTLYFDVQAGADAEDCIRSLSIRAVAPVLGNSFQGPVGVREITAEDSAALDAFSVALARLP